MCKCIHVCIYVYKHTHTHTHTHTSQAVAQYYATQYGTEVDGLLGWADDAVMRLNKNWKIDHAKVMGEKQRLMDAIFEKVGLEIVMADPALKATTFQKKNSMSLQLSFA